METVGSCYMAASGLSFLSYTDGKHATVELARMACDMIHCAEQLAIPQPNHDGAGVKIRIGMNVGPVLAGVIGVELPRRAPLTARTRRAREEPIARSPPPSLRAAGTACSATP